MFNSDNIDSLKLLAKQAGEAILVYYQKDAGITHKQDQSPLTLADIASHKIIYAGLTHLFPHIPVVSEEGEQVCITASRYFTIDPLDGTKEFIKGLPNL